jgi:hypothetical protein
MRTLYSFVGAAMLLGGAAVALPRVTWATVDMNGPWKVVATVSPDALFFPGAQVFCTPMTFTQVGTSLSAVGTCDLIGPLNLSGTIDPDTGEFTLTQSPAGFCSSFGLGGIAAPDSRTFTGGAACFLGTEPVSATVTGSRCGNGVLEAFEQCEDQGAGDCCNDTTCQFEGMGTACATDTNPCTDDVCDGSGVCQHPPNTGPCDDGNDCTTDVCGAGTCNGTAKAAGTPCTDHDACTVADECDGAGACIPGPPLVCEAPCSTGVCDPGVGCIADVQSCDDPTGIGGRLSLTNDTPDTKDKLAWTWSKGPSIGLADLGDPTVDTTYTVCLSDVVFADIGSGVQIVHRLRGSLTAAAGSKWAASHRGFKYIDKTATPDGLTSITLLSGKPGRGKIRVKGHGPNLGLSVPPLGTSSFPPLVQLKASTGRCWDTPELGFIRRTDTKLKAKGSPSGAFL